MEVNKTLALTTYVVCISVILSPFKSIRPAIEQNSHFDHEFAMMRISLLQI